MNPCEGLTEVFRPKVSLPAGERSTARAMRNLRKGQGAGGLGGMSETHPKEIELACFEDGEASTGVAEHLRWCARCRSVVADYRWLQGEVTATLALAADSVPVPRPKWWAVCESLSLGERRRAGRRRASALASLALVFSLILSAPGFLGAAVVAQAVPADVVLAPAPVTLSRVGATSTVDTGIGVDGPMVTPTPTILRGDGAFPAPAVPPLPFPTRPTPSLGI